MVHCGLDCSPVYNAVDGTEKAVFDFIKGLRNPAIVGDAPADAPAELNAAPPAAPPSLIKSLPGVILAELLFLLDTITNVVMMILLLPFMLIGGIGWGVQALISWLASLCPASAAAAGPDGADVRGGVDDRRDAAGPNMAWYILPIALFMSIMMSLTNAATALYSNLFCTTRM